MSITRLVHAVSLTLSVAAALTLGAGPGEAQDLQGTLKKIKDSGTITLVLVAGGLAPMQVLTAVINHPLTNFALGALFLFFALSLFGWYDITLPSWLQDATSAGEGKGGLAGVFFMALTFSIISFACVGPIYGGFLTVEAAGGTGQVQRVTISTATSPKKSRRSSRTDVR